MWIEERGKWVDSRLCPSPFLFSPQFGETKKWQAQDIHYIISICDFVTFL